MWSGAHTRTDMALASLLHEQTRFSFPGQISFARPAATTATFATSTATATAAATFRATTATTATSTSTRRRIGRVVRVQLIRVVVGSRLVG